MNKRSSRGKIITTLRDRLSIDNALRELGKIQSEPTLRAQAKRIAQRGLQVVPALIALLDTNDPQVRGGLGQVAVFLGEKPELRVIQALRAAVLAPGQNDQARITAITILERYLNQPEDPLLYAALSNPNAVMLSSLREMLAATEQSPYVYIEYVQQLEEQPPDIALELINALDAIEPPARITLLKLLAQDPRNEVAIQATLALGKIRNADALIALHQLRATVSQEVLPIIERGVRKLKLSGVQDTISEPTPEGWRALVSGVDGQGYSALFFVAPAPVPYRNFYAANSVIFLGALIHSETGVRFSFANATMPAVELPTPRTLGSFCDLLMPHSDHPTRFLEAPFEYGRHVLAQAAQKNYQQQVPTPHEYRLLNSLIWQFGPIQPPPIPEIPPLPDPLSVANLRTQSEVLLAHKVFSNWFLHTEAAYDAAEQALASRQTDSYALEKWVENLVEREFTLDIIANYQQRLVQMTPWLALSGDLETAALARHLAASLNAVKDLQHPFLSTLARVGIEKAMSNLQWGYDLRVNSSWK